MMTTLGVRLPDSRNCRLCSTVPPREHGAWSGYDHDSVSEAAMTRHAIGRRRRTCVVGISLLAAFAMVLPASSACASTFSWSQPHPVTTGGVVGITHLACAPGSTLCVGGDYFDGDVAASANATGGANEWIAGNVDGRNVSSTGESESTITGVACPSTTLCIATDDSGHILVSKHPAESLAAWTSGLGSPPAQLADVSDDDAVRRRRFQRNRPDLDKPRRWRRNVDSHQTRGDATSRWLRVRRALRGRIHERADHDVRGTHRRRSEVVERDR